eukprot:UN07378
MGGVKEEGNADERAMYKTLRDTFNAFDKDGSAQLGYPEYVEAWKFLDQPGTDADIKKAFDSVDVDASGLVESDESLFSIMGEAAMKYGILADMEKLQAMLGDTLDQFAMLKNALDEASGSAADRQK